MLTDIQCRTAKPKDKPYKLSDGKGLYLEINEHDAFANASWMGMAKRLRLTGRWLNDIEGSLN